MKRRRSRQYEAEEAVELDEVLEPYREQWAEEEAFEDGFYDEQPQENAASYADGYAEDYSEEYSPEHELADNEGRFRIAMGMLDMISIIIGIVVILVLSGMLITLFNWLKDDILHSALLLQSGLQ